MLKLCKNMYIMTLPSAETRNVLTWLKEKAIPEHGKSDRPKYLGRWVGRFGQPCEKGTPQLEIGTFGYLGVFECSREAPYLMPALTDGYMIWSLPWAISLFYGLYP